MADTIQFSLIGLEALEARLKSVNDDLKYKGGRFALRKAANLVAEKARAGAARVNDPKTPEQIEANIAVRWNGRRFRQTGDISFRVGVLGGARQYADSRENRRKNRAGQSYATDGDKSNPGGDTWHWRLVEFGREGVPAQPFMRTALSTSIDAAIAEFASQYQRSLDRAIRRAEKQGGG